MAEAKESKVDEANNSKENNENPPDLLQRFVQEKTPKETQLSNPQEPEQPDLNLKLSLGGIYNEIKTTKEKSLTRSSSTIGVITLNKESSDTPLPSSFLSLSRSCSLPVETQQEPKEGNVKELQAVNVKELLAAKRVEAIKKLMEKQRSVRGTNEKEKSPLPENPSSSPSKVVAWAASNVIKSHAFCRALVKIKEDNEKFEGLKESDAIKGSSNSKSSSEPKDSDPAVTSGTKANGKSVKPAETKLENPSKKAKVSNGSMECNGIDVMKQMPSVTTVGDGPNGRKVEGFLYRYLKGKVCIVCVCHGRFLSPAEFVKHAGGKDVENPMKHISVCPTAFSH